mgnify:CR=1 FL=1|jgi:hypothetical protein|tara:strand:+ start:315 stop:1136 length:822 start_codon:yes stop_codon:yes gene_type:complete
MVQESDEPHYVKRLNRVELCADSLKYAFSDVVYRYDDKDKFKLRKSLVSRDKDMSARKLRQVVNKVLMPHQSGILEHYNRDTKNDELFLFFALAVTLPSIWRTARFYYRNAHDAQTVGSLSSITGVSKGSISSKLMVFRRDHDGYLGLDRVSGISVYMKDVPGREQHAHHMFLHEPVTVGDRTPDAVVITGRIPEYAESEERDAFSDEIERVKLFAEMGKPVLELAGHVDGVIEVVKFVQGEMYASRYYIDEHRARLIHDDEPLESKRSIRQR